MIAKADPRLASGFIVEGHRVRVIGVKSAPYLGELGLSRNQFAQFEEHLHGEEYRSVSTRPC